MADLVLTDERRNELAALLDDEQRLRTEYPKVAEYLDTAPLLRGTGDDPADAAFDLRLVHYERFSSWFGWVGGQGCRSWVG